MLRSFSDICILNRRSQPNILKHTELLASKHGSHSVWPLRQNLEMMLGTLGHDVPDELNEMVWHLFMEEV